MFSSLLFHFSLHLLSFNAPSSSCLIITVVVDVVVLLLRLLFLLVQSSLLSVPVCFVAEDSQSVETGLFVDGDG